MGVQCISSVCLLKLNLPNMYTLFTYILYMHIQREHTQRKHQCTQECTHAIIHTFQHTCISSTTPRCIRESWRHHPVCSSPTHTVRYRHHIVVVIPTELRGYKCFRIIVKDLFTTAGKILLRCRAAWFTDFRAGLFGIFYLGGCYYCGGHGCSFQWCEWLWAG